MDIKLIEVVKKLKALDTKGNDYVNSLPQPFDMCVIDNDYSSSLISSFHIMLKEIFKEHEEDIAWFLYEWKPGNKEPQIWLADGTAIIVETEDQYYEYLAKYC